MADKKITELNAYTPPVDTDVLPLVDVTLITTKKITWSSIKAALKTYFDGLYGVILSKATALENVTGTDDAKFLTALANVPAFNNSLSRQAIINGNFDVWQRGTSFTNPNDVYTADRWNDTLSGATGITVTREAFTVGQTDVPGNPKFYYKKVVTTSNDNCRTIQKIEDVNNFAGQNATLSFWAKGTMPSTGTLYIGYQQSFGTGGSPSAQVTDWNHSALTITSTWTKFTVTIAVPSISGKTIGTDGANSSSLTISVGAGQNTNNGAWELNLSEVQLCAGDVALPFMPKSFDQELRACRRYCHSFEDSTTENIIGLGYGATTTVAAIYVRLDTPMRIAPSLVATAGDWKIVDLVAAGIDVTVLALSSTNRESKYGVVMAATVASGLTVGKPYFLSADGNANRSLYLEAEL